MFLGLAMNLVAYKRRTNIPSGGAGDGLLLENGLDLFLMEDGTSIILMETN